MNKLKAKVYAKINLNLLITGRLGDMHTLDSLMHSVSLYDIVEMSEGDGVYMDGVRDDKNSVNKVRSLMEECGLPSMRFDIKKGIPFSAGLGGSSADMSACVELVKKAYGVQLDTVRLGSDVTFMQKGGFARVSGIGDNIEYLPPLDLHLVVAKGKGGVSTKEAYRLFDESGIESHGDTLALISALFDGDWERVAKNLVNDLQAPAKLLNPTVADTYAHMRKCTDMVLMSGSGSAIFGIFRSKDEAINAEKILRSKVCFTKYATTKKQGVEIF